MIEIIILIIIIGVVYFVLQNNNNQSSTIPKDVQAFYNYTDSGILEKIIDINRRLREE